MSGQERKSVDIVVPIYNGYEDLILCVESLKAFTDLTKDRVILIDDQSPDERIRPYLLSLMGDGEACRSSGFCVHFNEKNQGFSANVNLGLAWSERDTILLNSDTIVTRGWVDKLQRAAYRNERTATVTPLSNAATLASVPEFLKDNPMPEGWTVQDYGDLCEKVSLRHYPRIPVGVGFCMYVKQKAYLLAGPFDQETFGRGYGEENDFCFRLEMLGMIHTLADDTFIYHKGTASFETAEKRALIEEHEKILRERYPSMMRNNDSYCQAGPDGDIRENLKLWQSLENGRKNILYFLHLDFREIAENNIGGTQIHVRDLVTGLRPYANVFVASRDGDALRLTAYPCLPEEGMTRGAEFEGLISMKFPIDLWGKVDGGVFQWTEGEKREAEKQFPVFSDPAFSELLRKILISFRIDLVHVHHTADLTLDIYEVSHDLKIPVIATLHDYYYACPSVKLLDLEGKFCPAQGEFSPFDPETCRSCLHRSLGYSDRLDLLQLWREKSGKALSLCERILFPSESAEKIMLLAFPELKSRSMVIPHGIDKAKGPGKRDLHAFSGPIQKSSRMHSHIDQMPGGDSPIGYLAGWAYLEGVKSETVQSCVEITMGSKRHLLHVSPTARVDVANAAADQDVLWCGFHRVMRMPGNTGAYRMRILLSSEEGLYTDGKIYRGHLGGISVPAAGDPSCLRLAFLGGVTPAKGSGLLRDLIRIAPADLEIFVFGQVGDPEVYEMEKPRNVHFSGVYRREELHDLLSAAKIDIACILPVWAETFSYTVSEAWECGIPVLGKDLGAVGERIRKTGAGWLIDPEAGAEDLIRCLSEIRENPGDLRAKKKLARSLSMRTVSEMNAEYRNLYQELIREPLEEKADYAFVFEGLAMANPGIHGRSGQAAQNRLREENEMLKASMEMLKGTSSYRIARKISDAHLPFKEDLKKLLRKIL